MLFHLMWQKEGDDNVAGGLVWYDITDMVNSWLQVSGLFATRQMFTVGPFIMRIIS